MAESGKEIDTLIIDPASTEFNRGSYCYLPYLLYSAMEADGHNVILWEDFSVAEIDELPKAKQILISLWSYPQVDACLVLQRFLDAPVSFFGYYPIIDHFGFPKFKVSDNTIKNGIKNYPKYLSQFNYILLSDCDMHLREYEGVVWPMFTSYGCPLGCTFCPSTVNCFGKRLVMPFTEVKDNLVYMESFDRTNIHFTDEDFFFDIDRAYDILKVCTKHDFNIISLGEAINVKNFVEKYGQNILEDSGMRLIEVGLETADEELARAMKKKPKRHCEWLAENVDKTDIFWLTLTFFPGETLRTLNLTGKFLKQYGFKPEQLYSRIATNGTEGGLGQFFQPYHGTKGYSKLNDQGIKVSTRPIRLIPSFIPSSFLECTVAQSRHLQESDRKWFDLYKIGHYLDQPVLENSKGTKIVDWVFMDNNYQESHAIFLAICARLGVI